MKPAFNVRQQSEIFIGPLADILSGVLPEGRVVVVSDSTIDGCTIRCWRSTTPC